MFSVLISVVVILPFIDKLLLLRVPSKVILLALMSLPVIFPTTFNEFVFTVLLKDASWYTFKVPSMIAA